MLFLKCTVCHETVSIIITLCWKYMTLEAEVDILIETRMHTTHYPFEDVLCSDCLFSLTGGSSGAYLGQHPINQIAADFGRLPSQHRAELAGGVREVALCWWQAWGTYCTCSGYCITSKEGAGPACGLQHSQKCCRLCLHVGQGQEQFFFKLPLSLPSVISFKFLLQPHQKYYTIQYEEIGFS